MANTEQPSDQLLRDAIELANHQQGFEPSADDMVNARLALEDDDVDSISPWGLLIVGYVAVARRGGSK